MPQNIGLTARLKFIGDAAIAGMRRAGAQFKGLNAQAQRLRTGFSNINKGLTGIGLAGAAAGAAAGFTVNKFIEFDGAMANVKAVLGDAQSSAFPALTAEAQRLGATTSFTATQAAQAMEQLARAGLKPTQILKSLGPVLDGAAADGIDLATAANIAVSNMAAFGLEASDTTRIMDTLAFVSRNTKSNMVALQEGLKFVAAKANGLKIPLEDTVAALGALNDIGLDATLAGTALKNSLIKLSNNAKRGRVAMKGISFQIAKTEEGGVDLNNTFQNMIAAMARIKDPVQRAAVSTKLLGIRGEGALGAFRSLTKQKADLLFKNLAKNAKGTAEEMRKIQLRSAKGQFTLLTSAIDGVVVAMGKAVFSTFDLKGGMGGLQDILSQTAKAFGAFQKDPELLDKTVKSIDGVSQSIFDNVKGVLLGLRDVKETVSSVFGAFGFDVQAGGVARLTTKLLGMAAVFAPIALGLKAVTGLFGSLFSIGKGAVQVTSGLLGLLGKTGAGKAAMSGLAGAIGKLTPAILGKAGLVGAVGAAAFGLGTLLDRWLGISDMISKTLFERLGVGKAATTGIKAETRLRAGITAREMAQQLVDFSRSGIKVGTEEGRKVAVTRAFAESRVADFLKTQDLNQQQIADALMDLKSTFQGIRVDVNVDGQKIATSTTKHQKQQRERGLPNRGTNTRRAAALGAR